MFKAAHAIYKHAKVVNASYYRSSLRYSSANKVLTTLQEFKGGQMNSYLNVVLNEPIFEDIPGLSERMKNVLEYTISGAKKIRATIIVSSYDMLEEPEYKSEESIKQSKILGVVAEMMASHILILDDIEDGSEYRHNKPCWYKLPGIGMKAITDAVLVKSLTFHIVQKHFPKHPHFKEILQLLETAYSITAIGQFMDTKTSQMSVDGFTMERYISIVNHKSSYCVLYPFLMGLALTHRVNDGDYHVQIKLICNNIACIYQRQNDYHDIYEIKFNRKEGSDIQDSKCSWLAVAALKNCNATQRQIFETNYGSDDPNKMNRVKQLYEELNMPQLYYRAQKQMYDDTKKHIDSLPDEKMRVYLSDLLDVVYKDIYTMF